MKKYVGALTSANYRIWMIGALVSNIGHWMQVIAQSWVVLTIVTDNDATAVGIVGALQFAPALILTPLAGVVTDKFERRVILLWTQSLLGILALAVGTLLFLDIANVWHLYISALLLGIIGAFDNPARQTIVADLVKEEHIANAVSISATSFNIGRLIGPAAGGFLISGFGAAWVFYFNTLAFALMFAMILLMNKAEIRTQIREVTKVKFKQALSYANTRIELKLQFAQVIFYGSIALTLPLFFSTMAVEFGLGADGYGIFSTYQAIGALAGAVIATRWTIVSLSMISWTALGFGFSVLFSSLMTNEFIFGLSLMPIGLFIVLYTTFAIAFVQTTTPNYIRGRIVAIYLALLVGSAPFGSLVFGPIIDQLGSRWGLFLAGVFSFTGVLISMIVFKILKTRNNRRIVIIAEPELDSCK